jgi:hypothetical protein
MTVFFLLLILAAGSAFADDSDATIDSMMNDAEDALSNAADNIGAAMDDDDDDD